MLYPGATHRLLRWQFWTRTNAPWILGVMHITGNPSKPPASASGEIDWRLTDPGAGNSATYFIDRDGTIFQALDPGWQVAWTNGDLNNPDTSHPAIARIVKEGINANRACYFTAELVGNEPNGYPITQAQVRSFAALLKFHAPHAKLPINASTVLGHRHFNSVSRQGCPTAGNLNALLNTAITYANQEDNVIVVPVLTYPAGSTLTFASGQTYKLFSINENTGAVTHRDYPGTGTTFPALGKVRIDGNADREAIAYRQNDGTTSYVSAWGPQPTVTAGTTYTVEDILAARATGKADMHAKAIVAAENHLATVRGLK